MLVNKFRKIFVFNISKISSNRSHLGVTMAGRIHYIIYVGIIIIIIYYHL